MENYGDYALGVGAGYASYVGSKQLLNKAKKPYVHSIMNNMAAFSQAESTALNKATVDAYNLSGLKSKGFYLHDVNENNVEKMVELINRKSKAVVNGNKYLRNLNKLKSKLEKMKIKAADFKNSKKAASSVMADKTTLSAINIDKADYDLFKKVKDSTRINGSVKFEDLAKKLNEGKITVDFTKNLKTAKIPKDIVKFDKPNKLKKCMQAVADGKNAFCSPLTRDIMVNSEKLGAASFHEMGHALNASGSKFTKYLNIGRHVTALAVPLILATGLLKSAKKDGEKPNGVVDKTTTFIKDNAGKLTFAALIPTLAEEGLASIRGGQLAKQVLSPSLVKKVNKGNFLAWTTYLAGALITSAAVALAVKVRDKVAG